MIVMEREVNEAVSGGASRLNVLMLNRGFSLTGGVPRVLLTYARSYDSNRVRLHMAGFKGFAAQMAEAFKKTGTDIYEIGDKGYLGPALRLRRILKQQQIDVIVATSLKAYLVAKLAAPSKCRVVYWIHAIALVTESRVKSAIYRRAARHDTLIFISDLVKNAHDYPGHHGRGEVVLNGVEDFLAATPLYDRSRRTSVGVPEDALVVGYTAAFIAWKEHKTLLAAFALLAKDYPRMHLALIGTGELQQAVQEQARTIAGGDRIHFLGLRPDARELLGIMDIYVQPSNGEGISIAIIEAMLARRPIVVSDAGALPDMIDDGVTGLMCRVLDADDLAEKIATFARDAELRNRLGESARQVALSRFGARAFAERITAIVESEPGLEHYRQR
jgi:glycosyltransferase involved in cell wall biosynthesis